MLVRAKYENERNELLLFVDSHDSFCSFSNLFSMVICRLISILDPIFYCFSFRFLLFYIFQCSTCKFLFILVNEKKLRKIKWIHNKYIYNLDAWLIGRLFRVVIFISVLHFTRIMRNALYCSHSFFNVYIRVTDSLLSFARRTTTTQSLCGAAIYIYIHINIFSAQDLAFYFFNFSQKKSGIRISFHVWHYRDLERLNTLNTFHISFLQWELCRLLGYRPQNRFWSNQTK